MTNIITINNDLKNKIKEARIHISGDRIIEFKDDREKGNTRDSWKVPTELLLFRKENARIESKVRTWEKSKGPIEEDSDEGQNILGRFLAESDTKSMKLLKTLLEAHGQIDPAVCTADGRLLNGNRRLRAFRELEEDNPGLAEKFKYMEVVILPSGDASDGYGEGLAPTVGEIQALEYSYQVQLTGRSEYTGLNRALMYRSNIEKRGIDLKTLLSQDPSYKNHSRQKFNAAVKKIEQDYLETLQEFDNYLEYFDRDGMYDDSDESGEISSDRWQAFVDWTKSLRKIKDERNHARYNINLNDIGSVTSAAYKLIRQQELHGAGKINDFMRQIPKTLEKKHTKRMFFKIADEKNIPSDITEDEKKNEEGAYKSNSKIDSIWSTNNAPKIISLVKKIKTELTYEQAVSKPVSLLEEALAKLNHDSMNSDVLLEDNQKCMELCTEIIDKADDLYSEFDNNRMRLDDLSDIGK